LKVQLQEPEKNRNPTRLQLEFNRTSGCGWAFPECQPVAVVKIGFTCSTGCNQKSRKMAFFTFFGETFSVFDFLDTFNSQKGDKVECIRLCQHFHSKNGDEVEHIRLCRYFHFKNGDKVECIRLCWCFQWPKGQQYYPSVVTSCNRLQPVFVATGPMTTGCWQSGWRL
jgi:hypothetical protein